MNLRRIVLLFGLSLIFSIAHAQQPGSGSIRGTVTLEDGQVVPGVIITAVDESGNNKYETYSNSRGEWAMLEAAAGGPYTVTANLTGFKTDVKKDVLVKPEEASIVDFVMQVEQVN